MVPESPRCTVDILTLPEMVGFFVDINASISSNPHLTNKKRAPE
jgi:hypothetical protein